MTVSKEQVFLIIIIMNTVVTSFYLLWGLLIYPKRLPEKTPEKKETEGGSIRIPYLLKGIVMFLCPLAGPLFFLAGHLLYHLLFRQNVDLTDVIFSKERVETHMKADVERGHTLVPIEEALAVSDKDSLRSLMMNVIKEDVQDSLASIALALNSEDSETSHYAASALRDELNDFRITVQKIFREVENEQGNQAEYAILLMEYMNNVLKQKVFTGLEQKSLVHMFTRAGEILYEKEKAKMTGSFFEWICLRLLEIEEFDLAEIWCTRQLEEYPHELSSYTCQLKLYFTLHEKDKFFKAMDALKKSDIVIDRETLELIRIFS